jgi:hypothetical protein
MPIMVLWPSVTGSRRICFASIASIATCTSSSGEQTSFVMTSFAVILAKLPLSASARQAMSRSVTIPTNWPSA